MRKARAYAIPITADDGPDAIAPARTENVPNMTAVERELAILDRARRDPRALAPLYEQYADSVWRFAFSRLGDRDRAADATAQTFVKAIAALPRFRPKRRGDSTGFQAWLMQIARNVIIDEARKRRPTTSDADIWQSLHDPAPGPAEIAHRAEEIERVRAAIRHLPGRQQELIRLRMDGLSGQEIADALGMTIAGVRTANHRAFNRLRELLQDEENRS